MDGAQGRTWAAVWRGELVVGRRAGKGRGRWGRDGVETCGDEKIHGVESVLDYEPLPEYFLVEKGGGEGVDTVGKPADVNVLFLAF
jgi:hypothetical protein